jgi:hypothetical protein
VDPLAIFEHSPSVLRCSVYTTSPCSVVSTAVGSVVLRATQCSRINYLPPLHTLTLGIVFNLRHGRTRDTTTTLCPRRVHVPSPAKNIAMLYSLLVPGQYPTLHLLVVVPSRRALLLSDFPYLLAKLS